MYLLFNEEFEEHARVRWMMYACKLKIRVSHHVHMETVCPEKRTFLRNGMSHIFQYTVYQKVTISQSICEKPTLSYNVTC